MRMKNQFVDTYSDDLIYLEDAKELLLKNNRAEVLVTPAFCRIYIVFTVGAIEAAITSWKDDSGEDILSTYFPAENVSNEKRLDDLYEAFVAANFDFVERDVFYDYVAIKHLRNKIIHAIEEDQQSKDRWIISRNFPIDTRDFKEEHWNRLKDINEKMTFYIGTAMIKNNLNKGKA